MHGAGFDDLTARAKIRQAAMAQFAEHGYEKTTIRGIAAVVGVSPGLVRHHFGSKQGLRDAVDTHVLNEVRRINDEVMVDVERGDFAASTASRAGLRPFMPYLARALVAGSPIVAALFDQMVEMTEPWFKVLDLSRQEESAVDARARAAVFNAMALGVPLLHEHISRAAGMDITTDEVDRLIAYALLDLYSHAIISPELADAARRALDTSYPNPENAHTRRRT